MQVPPGFCRMFIGGSSLKLLSTHSSMEERKPLMLIHTNAKERVK